jgi:putative DNA primase/helicase
VFQGRIVFPYWNCGKVVNFAARGSEKDKEGKVKNESEHNLLKTPDTPYEAAKYKKLLVHSEKRPYINKSINNRYLFGEDSIRKQDYCIITEGIADAIMLMQNDIPVLSPVTVQFAENDHDKLVHAARKLKTVYICNDNEASCAGEHGAIKTALLLKDKGVDVKIILLPKENLSKMDVAEYFLRHTKEEFNTVKEQSKDILVHLLNKVQVSTCADPITAKAENFDKAIEFTETVLKNISNAGTVDFFIRNNIKGYFDKFTMEDVRAITKIYKAAVAEESSKNPNKDSKMVFDLDSETGRSSMVRILAREVMQEKHIKYVAGMLRIYNDGVYPVDADARVQLQKDILMLGEEEHKTPIIEKHANSVIKVLEILNATREEECACTADELAVNNGVLNLNTFELTPFTPEKVFFNKLPVNYEPDAPEPKLFLSLMEKVFVGNEEQYKLMQEVFGFCLLNNYKYQSIIYLLGDGGNGKGTVIKMLNYMLGNEATSSATLHQLTDHPNVDYYLAQLHGKRANICGDLGSKKVENTENIKKLSSNTDRVSARLPYGVPFDFINYAKIIFALNKMPKKDAFTTGDKRRDVIISFNNHISDTSADIKGYAELIKDNGEMSGVFNWALEGLKRLERNQKFSDKRTVAQKGLEYDMKSNPMKYFVDECIDEGAPSESLPNAMVYNAYNKYRKIHGMPELSEQEIKNGLKYWCNQISITVTEKREQVNKLCGFITPEIKAMFGDAKRIRVFTGIKLIESETAEEKGLNAFIDVTPVANGKDNSVLADFKNALCD